MNTPYQSSDIIAEQCMTRSLTKELFTPFKDPKREFCSSWKLLKTLSLDESSSPKFDLSSDLEEHSEGEIAESMMNMTYRSSDITLESDSSSSMTRLKLNETFTPFEEPEQEFRSSRKLFKTLSLDESSTSEVDLFFNLEEHSEGEIAESMMETIEEYMCKTRGDYGSGVTRPKIDDKAHFELKDQFLKELRDNTFSGCIMKMRMNILKKILEIVDLFHIPDITQDQIMLQAFPISLTEVARR
ncbi:hypothetical protein Tco_0962310 [Tanacetum coccineum]